MSLIIFVTDVLDIYSLSRSILRVFDTTGARGNSPRLRQSYGGTQTGPRAFIRSYRRCSARDKGDNPPKISIVLNARRVVGQNGWIVVPGKAAVLPAPTGAAALRRGPTERENAAGGRKMPVLTDHYMLRRYLPPTSYNAPVIWPREQVFTASISSAKMLPPDRATFWSRSRAAGASP